MNSSIIDPHGRPTKAAFVLANPKSRLVDQVREVLRVKHYSLRTVPMKFQEPQHPIAIGLLGAGGWKHPREMGGAEIGAFLSHLATGKTVAASTQNQALNPFVFLYREVANSL